MNTYEVNKKINAKIGADTDYATTYECVKAQVEKLGGDLDKVYDIYSGELQVLEHIGVDKPSQSKTLDIDANGTYNVTPDEGYTLNKVTVSTSIPEQKPEQTKSATIQATKSTVTKTVTPDSGKVLSSVSITVNPVASQTKTVDITQNGSYDVNADTDKSLDTVKINVNVEGGGTADCFLFPDGTKMGYAESTFTEIDLKGATSQMKNFENFLPNEITSVKGLDLTNATNCHWLLTMYQHPNLTTVEITKLPQQGCNYSRMFQQSPKLKTMPITDFSQATSTEGMYAACTGLTEINRVGRLDLPKSENCANMFYNCTNLTNVAGVVFGSSKTGSVCKYASYMFAGGIEIGWNTFLDYTDNLIDVSYMFKDAKRFSQSTTQGVNISFPSVTNAEGMFMNVKFSEDWLYNSLEFTNSDGVNVSKMFQGANEFPISNITFNYITDLSYFGANNPRATNNLSLNYLSPKCEGVFAFSGSENYDTNWAIDFYDVSKVETFANYFYGFKPKGTLNLFYHPDNNDYSTIKYNNVIGMFQNCTGITGIYNFNWGKVKNGGTTTTGNSDLSIDGIMEWSGNDYGFYNTFKGCTALEEITFDENSPKLGENFTNEYSNSCYLDFSDCPLSLDSVKNIGNSLYNLNDNGMIGSGTFTVWFNADTYAKYESLQGTRYELFDYKGWNVESHNNE